MSKTESHVCNSDGFILVASSKKKRGKVKPVKRLTSFGSSLTDELSIKNHSVNIEDFLKRFSETELDLAESSFFRKSIEKVLPILKQAEIETIICLGLGKLSECAISRYQLAFVRCVQRELQFRTKIQYFDPILSRGEVEILQRLDGVVLTENLEGKYLADRKTLFYLPHCPKQISNNLLWRNWRPDLLENVFLVGNSFEGIANNSPRRFLEKNAHFILEIIDCCKEISLDNNFRFTDIFNDTSLHYFDSSALQTKVADFWDSAEPDYTEEDLELITNTIQASLQIAENGHS